MILAQKEFVEGEKMSGLVRITSLIDRQKPVMFGLNTSTYLGLGLKG